MADGWWNDNGNISGCVAAYQPVGAASASASYVNLFNPGANNAAPQGTPVWDATDGWKGNGSWYLTTGIVPVDGQTTIVRYSGISYSSTAVFCGTVSGNWYFIAAVSTTSIRYAPSSAAIDKTTNYGSSGVIAMSDHAYYNKTDYGALTTSTHTGAMSILAAGAGSFKITANVLALATYSAVLTAEQIATITDAMNNLPNTVDLTAADFTLAQVTFDTPTLGLDTVVDLTATDLSLSGFTFDSPDLSQRIVSPDCRTLVIDKESRVLGVESESRSLVIGEDQRGIKFYCHGVELYSPVHHYSPLNGADLTLNKMSFDQPEILPYSMPLPDPVFSYLPFGIVDDGDGTFSIAPSFDLQTYAGITVNKTYYVSTSGNNSNDGLTSGTALRTLTAAINKGDADRVYIAAGHYGWGECYFGSSVTRSVELIGSGNVFLTWDLRIGGFIGSFSKVDNHYEASYTSSDTLTVIDMKNLDASGDPPIYTLKTSSAEVDASAGSYYYDTTTDKVYIRTSDDRAPDTDIFYMRNGSYLVPTASAGVKVYIENIKLYCNGNNIGQSGSGLYFKDCTLDMVYGSNYAVELATGCEVIAQNCKVLRAADDGIRNNGGKLINVDCYVYSCGATYASNCTSCHDGYAVFVNGEYHHSYGRPIHDTGNGKAWYLGVNVHHAGQPNYPNILAGPSNDVGFETWCDQCISSDSDYDFAESAPGSLHKHDCTGSATDYGAVDTYDY